MRRIVDDHVETAGPKRHPTAVPGHLGPMFGVPVEAHDRSPAAVPESAAVDGRVEDEPRRPARIKTQKPFQ